jgi:acyl-coenzyme A synthetase/AMP-(fatty) acid ligase
VLFIGLPIGMFDVLWLTAAFFDKWVYTLKKDDIRFLKTILTGGEVVNSLTVEYLRNKFSSLSVVDGYGPTENTTFTTTYTVKQDTPKNIPFTL